MPLSSPEKESKELRWLRVELKKAGGRWGVGAGRTGGAAQTSDLLESEITA